MKLCRLEAHHASAKPDRWVLLRPVFAVAISHPDALIAAREASQPGDLILPNITAPPHPVHPALGDLVDRLRDLDARDGLLDTEEVSDDGRDINLTYWAEVVSDEEALIVGSIAYWSSCWTVGTAVPVRGGVELVE